MKNLLTIFLILIIFFSCKSDLDTPLGGNDENQNSYFIIPEPLKLIPAKGKFKITADTRIIVEGGDEAFKRLARSLGRRISLNGRSNFSIDLEGASKDAITFRLDKNILNPEGYHLEITPYDITITASALNGIYYAIQTFSQLMPKEGAILKDGKQDSWEIPCVRIVDEPRYPYRGMHLDVVRHFFSVDFVKKYINEISRLKMNKFHWHLTDDQGWRIEIKKYPKLQEIAAFRKETIIGHNNDHPRKFDGQRYGGFYTQEEIKEVVQYANERFVTVIPEIEMPGHSQAVLAAYPELACTNGPFDVATSWGVFDEVFCPNEATFTFLENVLTEVFELFPSEYIHIGGDECPKKRWKESAFCQQLIKEKDLKDEHGLQSYFIQRMEKFINSKDKRIIGWDEILEGGLAPNATVMSWRGMEGGIEAAKAKHEVIMTPTSHCYFDYYQSKSDNEPLAIGGYLPLEKVYNFEPTPDELTTEEAKYILGAQGNVWTEYIKKPRQVEYMVFPRAFALAEVVWSPKEKRNYEDFGIRLVKRLERLKSVNFASHIYDVQADMKVNENGIEVKLFSNDKEAAIHYTTDGKGPKLESKKYTEPFLLENTTKVRANTFKDGKRMGRMMTQEILVHSATGRHIDLTNPPNKNFNAGESAALVNGILGSKTRFNDNEWIAWSGQDMGAVIDLGTATRIDQVTIRFFNDKSQWIYLPKKIKISISDDAHTFNHAATIEPTSKNDKKNLTVKATVRAVTQFIRVEVEHFGLIPAGAPGAGEPAWLFVDEIVVE